MKKNAIIAVAFLVFLGTSVSVVANPPGRKKKKKKTETTEQVASADSMAAAAKRSADSVTATLANADNDTSAKIPSYLLADSSVATMDNFTLDSTKPVDGFYKQTTLRGARPFALPTTSINNIKKYKRIWRQIDLTDSVNAIFNIPDQELMRVLVEAIKAGKIVAYEDDEFKKAKTYNQVMKLFIHDKQVHTTTQTGEDSVVKTSTEFRPDQVKKYEIKEDLYFDKVHGKLITDIISFAPVMPVLTSNGDEVPGAEQHPFVLNFIQLRKLLAGREVTDLKRDISNMSYDDLLITGNFSSQIIKDANPKDRSIKEMYPDPVDQLKESKRIEQEIRNYQKSLWKY